MILDRMSEMADQAVVRYEMMCSAWRISFQNALNKSGVSSLNDLLEEAYSISRQFIEAESYRIGEDVREIAYSAADTTREKIASVSADELSDAALEHLGVIQSYILDEIIAQIRRDVALVQQTYNRAMLDVSISARARGVSERIALVEFLIERRPELRFTFHDRASRRWSSNKFVRSTYRQGLLTAYNETVLMTIADHGLTRARVSHVDPKAEVAGMIVSLIPSTDIPVYSEVRDSVFHPNANAILETELAHV